MRLRDLLLEFCIYKIINLINGKIYIGKTNNVNKRWYEHLRVAKTKEKTFYLYSSINKYGADNFKIEIIEDNLTEQDSLEKEKFWIKELNSNDPNIGMNLTNGGEGVSGLKWSEESRNGISGEKNHNFGKPISDEVKQKISNAVSGEKNGFFGKNHTKETIFFLKNREVSEDQKKKSSEGTRGNNHPNSKFVEQDIIKIREMFSTGNYTQTELSKIFNTKPNVISQIVNRIRWKHI